MKIQTKSKILKWIVTRPYIPYFLRIKFQPALEKTANQFDKLIVKNSIDYEFQLSQTKKYMRDSGEKVQMPNIPYQHDRIVFAQDKEDNKITIMEDTGQVMVLDIEKKV